MEEKLQKLYEECKKELQCIGIELHMEDIGMIDIKISKRNYKRYGCCKQEEPDEHSKRIEKRGYKKIIRYDRFWRHHIEISPWVMNLEKSIIKNTIMHEMIHCLPYCHNHGTEFKKYAQYINQNLGYNIARVGNKKEDYQNSNLEYIEDNLFKYKISCKSCRQTFYRKRYQKNFIKKYRCGKCGGKFMVEII